MERVKRFAIFYIVAVSFFVWGLAVGRWEVFPAKYMISMNEEIFAFINGDVVENVSVFGKLENDLGISPERHIRAYSPPDRDKFHSIALDDKKARRADPRVWISPSAPEGYRIIVGAFDFEDAFWGAIMLDPAGSVVHRWAMNGEVGDLSDYPDVLKTLYGVAFLPDGSAIFSMQEQMGGLAKIDYCGALEWTKKGVFHHTVSPIDDFSAFWTFGGKQGDMHPKLLLVNAASGETMREIDMAEVGKANPDISILDLQPKSDMEEATHPNDIDPLPERLAQAFPAFAAGDLAISYNTTNLIFVLDPETLKIKWWYTGSGDGQHDPDWQADGTITIFNNNYRALRRGTPVVSTIVAIDPMAKTHRTALDGTGLGFYSNFNGHHQFTEDGTVIVTSSTQGWVFEADPATGETVFEFVNAYEWADDRTLHLAEALVVPAGWAERWVARDCPVPESQPGE